ncbi:hypothetical protein [Burkholderia stagnalis]|uniref:hypothetical protein n=1 Tax=Burkholderia stagnalis TaxID=1503054 RepID=UPI001F49DF31|nr:hypothetical protein [Burkholderia stagnalis]
MDTSFWDFVGTQVSRSPWLEPLLLRCLLRSKLHKSASRQRKSDRSRNDHNRAEDTSSLESSAELQEKLEAIEASVKNCISTNSLDDAWREWSDVLKEAMKSDRSTGDLEFRSETPVRAIASYGYDAHFLHRSWR